MKIFLTGLLGFFVVFTCASLTMARENSAEDDEGYVMIPDMPEGIPLETLLELASVHTGKKFVYDAKLLQGRTARLLVRDKIPRKWIYQVVEAVMETQDFALLPPPEGTHDLVKVVQAGPGRGKHMPVFGPEEADKVPVEDVLITQIFRLKYLDPLQFATHLRGALGMVGGPSAAAIAPIQGTDILVITDWATNMIRISKIIAAADVKGEEPEIEIYKLKHARANDVQPKVQAALQPLQAVVPGRKAAAAGVPAQAAIIADPPTNSLIIVAMRETLDKILQIITGIDKAPEVIERGIHVYKVRHGSAKKLADTLNALNLAQAFAREAAVTGQTPGQQKVVTIGADEETNSLVIVAEQEDYEVLLDVLNKLDRRANQVMIEAVIFEIFGEDETKLGFDLATIGRPGDSPRGFAATALGAGGIKFRPDAPNEPLIRDPLGGAEGTFVAGIFKDSPGRIPILLKALKKENKIKILSTPAVLTNDNVEAKILTKKDTPVKVVTDVGGAPGTVRTAPQYESAVLDLTIKPHITEEGYLRLEIRKTIQDFGEKPEDPTMPPERTSRELKASVTVPDRHTIIIGGLLRTRDSAGESKVPVLGDIPLLGNLFKFRGTRQEHTKLYLLITPHIMTSPAFSDVLDFTRKKQEEAYKEGGKWLGIIPSDDTKPEEPRPLEFFDYKSPFWN